MQYFIGQLVIWALFTGSTMLGAALSSAIFGTNIDGGFVFGFSLGVALMQGFNYEMNNKGKDQ